MKQPMKLYAIGVADDRGSRRLGIRAEQTNHPTCLGRRSIRRALRKKRRIFHDKQGRDGWEG